MAALVFISYASGDHDRARVVRDDLEADGIPCWMASRDILGSDDYVTAIPPAIEHARVVLLVLSAAALASEHVFREVHLATDDKKPILPVRVEPITAVEGLLKFPLAGKQWVDATPRVEPALGRIRAEVRRLLATEGVVIKAGRRSGFERVLASAGAWSLVVVLTLLIVLVLQAYWINLVPWWQVPRWAAQHPLALAALLAPALIAVAVQYFLHRRLRAALTLDALFAFAPRAAQARTLAAASAAALLAVVVSRAPDTVQLEKSEQPPEARYGNTLTHARECGASYYDESTQFYDVSVRVGGYNPSGTYALRVELRYADPDSVNFCNVWTSAPFQLATPAAELDARWDDTLAPNRIRFIEIRRPRDAFVGSTHVVFTLVHPRRSPPQRPVEGTATLVFGDYVQHSAPASISPSDWDE